MKSSLLVACCAAAACAQSVTVQVLADSGRIPISPWIYGRNNSLSLDASKPVSDSLITLYKEAGVRSFRENGGNNATKYNWRRKLTSAPDWYNNVYGADWDYAATTLQNQLPGTQGVSAFQLLGWAARTDSANFGDWAYNQSQWWSGVKQNLAGDGVLNPAGGNQALTNGDPTKYLQTWPADSTVAILPHWFGPGGLGLDSTRFRYWGMDNEPDGWSSTHDDVDSALTGHILTEEDYVQRWVAVAKAARRIFPGIRLVGPAFMSEWQWYTWENSTITYKGKLYSSAEYLIKRLAEIQDSTGVRMLDVFDIHFYYASANKYTLTRADWLQSHRILFDRTYSDPAANGLLAKQSWQTDTTQQYILGRIQDWLNQYFGKGHGIGVGMTESAADTSLLNTASMAAVWHASVLGTLADNGGELYTAWSWYPGMWEVQNLYGRYAHPTKVTSVSTLDSLVSGYSSISTAGDSLLVILVNRDATNNHATTVNLTGFTPTGNAVTLQLANLNGETFFSHTKNALNTGTATVSGTSLSLTLPKMSITAVQLLGTGHAVTGVFARTPTDAKVTLVSGVLRVEAGAVGTVRILEFQGRTVASSSLHQGLAEIAVGGMARGIYTVQWPGGLKRVALLGN